MRVALTALTFLWTAFLPLPGQAQQPNSASYERLLAQVKRGSADVDFQALRYAYAAGASYAPYGGKTTALRSAMFKAFAVKDCATAIAQTDEITDINYLDIEAHQIADLCYRWTADRDRSAFHHAIALGLLHSILRSGDGKSPETAFVVIATTEEYSLLNALGRRPMGQSVLSQNGHNYDRIKVRDSDRGSTAMIYFNIDRPFGWLNKSFKRD